METLFTLLVFVRGILSPAKLKIDIMKDDIQPWNTQYTKRVKRKNDIEAYKPGQHTFR